MPDDADYQRISHPCVAAAVEVSRIQSGGVPRNGSQSDGTDVMRVEMATAVATARCRRRFQSSMTPAWEGSRLGPPTQSQRPPSPGRSHAYVPTSSAPARLAPRAHRGAPRCARTTRVLYLLLEPAHDQICSLRIRTASAQRLASSRWRTAWISSHDSVSCLAVDPPMPGQCWWRC